MSDKPLRRQITLVLEMGPNGPGEINRGFYSDEYLGRSGAIELSPAANIDEASLAGLLPDLAAVTAQLVATQDALKAAKIERDEAVKAKADAEADRDQKVEDALKKSVDSIALAANEAASRVAAAEADRDAKIAEASADRAAQVAAVEADRAIKVAQANADAELAMKELEAAKARITDLEAQIAAAAVPDDAIHIAYFEAALADMKLLDAVTEAISADPVRAALWRRATSIRIGDADVVAVAKALEIDLQAVFARAKAIQAARSEQAKAAQES